MRTVCASILLLVSACGDTEPLAPPFPPGDGSVEPPAGRILTLDEPDEVPLALEAGASVTLRFSLVGVADGEPASGVSVACDLRGELGEATLEARAETDADGEATFALGAGDAPAYVTAECRAPRASSVRFEIAVSPSGSFGAFLVSPAYEGARSFTSTRVDVRFGVACDEADEVDHAARFEGGGSGPVTVAPLPAELEPTFTVALVDADGRAVARGCAEEPSAGDGEERPVEVQVDDLPLEIAGEYSGSIGLRTESAPPAIAASGRVAAQATLSAFGDEVDYMMAKLRAGLTARGHEIDLVTLDADIADNYGFQLAEAYALDQASPETAVLELERLALESAGAIWLDGVIRIERGATDANLVGFTPTRVSAGPTLGSTAPLSLAALPADATGVGSVSAPSGGATLASFRIDLGGAAIVSAGVRAGLAAAPEAALTETFGCPTFATLPVFEGTLVECDEACRSEICEAALGEITRDFIDGLEGASFGDEVRVEAELTFEGSGVTPSGVSVDSVSADLVDGALTIEPLEVELTLGS